MEPEEKLWKLNCITYSVAVAWRNVNDDYQEPLGDESKGQGMWNVERKILQRDSFYQKLWENTRLYKSNQRWRKDAWKGGNKSARNVKKLKQQFPNSFWNIHDDVAQPERLILVRWMNWETEWKTSWKPHVFGNDFKPVWCFMKCFLVAYSERKTNAWRWKP